MINTILIVTIILIIILCIINFTRCNESFKPDPIYQLNIHTVFLLKENIPFLKDIYRNVFLFPPFFNTDIKCKTKNIDILSITNNSYRTTILNNNVFDKFRFNILFIDNCYGQLRDEYFSTAKVYINIHGSDNHCTMEMIRLVNLIFKKVIIISQKSISTDLLFLKDYIIICNDLDNLVEYTSEILYNYEFYYNKIYGNFDEDKYYLYIKNNIDQIIYSD